MPLYEFKCDCGYAGEKIVPIRDLHSTVCPDCGGILQRVFSPFAIKVAVPLIYYQEQPHGQKPVEIGRVADSSYSDERNLDIPPDYPNLLEV